MVDKENETGAPEGKTEEKKAPARKRTPKAKDKDVKVEVKKSVRDFKALDTAMSEQEPAAAVAPKAEISAAPAVQEPRKPQIDRQGRAYATGRRKDAVARVWLKPGKGAVIVNGRDQAVYFARQTQRLVLNQPFLICNRVGMFDVICTVKGGGLTGQAGAVRLGISRALQNFDPELRGALKKAGMLTRDARAVERKKIGLHKARRSKQWAKR